MSYLRRILHAGMIPAVALLIFVLTVSEAQGHGGFQALLSIWNVFRILHYIPEELASKIGLELFNVSIAGPAAFYMYSMLAFLTFIWAMLCSEALRQVRGEQVRSKEFGLVEHRPLNTTGVTVRLSFVLSAVGKLQLVKVLTVLFAATFMYVIV